MQKYNIKNNDIFLDYLQHRVKNSLSTGNKINHTYKQVNKQTNTQKTCFTLIWNKNDC